MNLRIDIFFTGFQGTCTTQEIFIAIEQYRSCSGHATSYQKTLLGTTKRFLLWLIESEYNTTLNSTKIMKLQLKSPYNLKTANDILTGSELQSIFEATKNLRDRALLEVLYDSMGRIGEIAMLKWDQIQFQQHYATVTLESKTGIPRKVPLYTSHVVLRQWMNHYPVKKLEGKYIFQIANSGGKKNISYDTVRTIVARAQISAGIEKKITPHIFRHTRITDLMRIGVSEQTIKMLAWGTVTTDMLKVYAHLTSTDAENEMNRMMGITTNCKLSALPDIANPVKCNECGLINPKANKFCGGCTTALSDEDRIKHEHILSALKNKDVFEEIAQFILLKTEEAKTGG